MKQNYYWGFSEEGFHRIAYLEWGERKNSQLTAICVHGLTRNSHDFDPLAKYLAVKNIHVFCPDVVGRGDSDWLKNPLHYTYEQYGADMTNMITRTNAPSVVWIGTSMGGLIGMLLASLPKSPIRCLILNDIGPQVPAKGIARLASYAGKDPQFSSIEAAKAYFKSTYQTFGPLTEAEWQQITLSSVKQKSGKYITKLDERVKLTSAKGKFALHSLLHPYKALEGVFFDVDLWHIWRSIQCPVLVIRGENSDLLTPAIVEKMQQTHTDTEELTIQDTGHAPMLFKRKHHEAIYNWLMKHT